MKNNENLPDDKRLRELAEKATQGPWVKWDGHAEVFCNADGENSPGIMDGDKIAECVGSDLPDNPEWGDDEELYNRQAEANADFIAIASPTTVRSLLDRIEELELQIREANQRFGFYKVSAEESLATGIDNVFVKGRELAEAERDRMQAALTVAESDAKSWKSSFEMYRKAWIRELGGWLIPKSHEIDALVLTTRRRCVNPLLGNCSVPHLLDGPTPDRKALQQTPHPRNHECRDWKVEDETLSDKGVTAE